MKNDDVYNVEKIVDSRMVGGKKQYLIKWEGYSSEFNTWEYEKDIFCKNLIAQYEENLEKSKNSQKGGKKRKSDISTEATQNKEPAMVKPSPAKKPKASEPVLIKELKSLDSWEDIIDEVITVQWNARNKRLDVQFRTKSGDTGIVPAKDAHIHFPQALITFYEKHISFKTDSENGGSDI